MDSQRTSSLLVTVPENETALDRITRAIYAPDVIAALNQPIVDVPPVLINRWSLTHGLWGAGAQAVGLSAGQTFWAHTAFEAAEAILGEASFTVEEVVDVGIDTAFAMAGWWLADASVKRLF